VIQRVRVALIALGVIAFTVAQQTGREWLRWVGIVLVGAALLLRFVR
jgi:protein-S-isoprenylcysteine O-methyltransferase Ste14